MTRVLAITMLTVFAVVPSAEACGWILWAFIKERPASSAGRSRYSYAHIEAYETLADCKSAGRAHPLITKFAADAEGALPQCWPAGFLPGRATD
jgi:hypothetical protein